MESMSLTNGFIVKNLTKESIKILDFLIKCKEQADEFIFQFLMQSTNENLAVRDYRVHTILKRQLTLKEFVEQWKICIKKALEQMFMCPISKSEVTLLTNKIKDGIITIEDFFHRHKENPRHTLFRLLP